MRPLSTDENSALATDEFAARRRIEPDRLSQREFEESKNSSGSSRMGKAAHWLHVGTACMYLLLLPLATAPKDIAFIVLIVIAAARLKWTAGVYPRLLRDPMGWLLAAWALWQGASIAWSSNPAQGFDEFKAMRVLITPLLLWPVMAQLPALIGALLIGVFAQNLVQLMQGLEWFGLHPADNDRLRGLIHPIMTATFCAAAICWHMSASLQTRGLVRWISIAGMGAAALGLLATGSRGPWIAAAVCVPLCLLTCAIRIPRARRMAIVLACLGIAGSVAAWPMFGTEIRQRINQAFRDIDAAEANRTIATSVGLRLESWNWAWQVFLSAPIQGVGAGGYQDAVRRLPDFQAAVDHEPRRRGYIDRSHPHSTYLYTLACTGAIGGTLLAVILGLASRRAWRDRLDHPYAAASIFVLGIWLIGGCFDSFTLNGHDFGLLLALGTFIAPYRPRPKLTLAAPAGFAFESDDQVRVAVELNGLHETRDRGPT